MAQIDIDSGWSNNKGDQMRQIPSRAMVNNTLICDSRDLAREHKDFSCFQRWRVVIDVLTEHANK